MSPLFGAGLTSPAGVPKATVTGTTGSPTTNNNARAGKTIYQFNGSGSITVGTAGSAEILVVAGGGGSQLNPYSGAGGGGGVIYDTAAYLPSGTSTITVGAGGVANFGTAITSINGRPSIMGNYVAVGGGGAAGSSRVSTGDPNAITFNTAFLGGSGGGAFSALASAGGTGIPNQGFDGGSNNAYARSGGGGGAGGAGASGSTTPNGGIGRLTNINGSAVYYGGGGGGGGSENGASGGTGGSGGGGNGGNFTSVNAGNNPNSGGANTGGGGGGTPGINNAVTKSTGGSGIVIVVVG